MLKETDILELKDRYLFLMQNYVQLASQLAPEIEKLGKYRKELLLIIAEYERRGVPVDDPDWLEKLVQQELKSKNGENTDQREGHSESGQDST